MTPEELAKIAYAAYGRTTDYKNYQGNPMPEWSDLTDKIREAWISASDAVAVISVNTAPDTVTLDERERAQVVHAVHYANQFSAAGVPGHGQFMLIAKLAKALHLT